MELAHEKFSESELGVQATDVLSRCAAEVREWSLLDAGWESERKALLDEIPALLDKLDAPSLLNRSPHAVRRRFEKLTDGRHVNRKQVRSPPPHHPRCS